MALNLNDPVTAQQTADRAVRVRAYEWQVRPFQDPNAGQRLLDRITKRRNKAGETSDASATWGAASNFDIQDDKLPTVQLVGGSDPNQQQDPSNTPPAQQTVTYTEVNRTTTRVTITDSQNPDNSVVVERIDTITFKSDQDQLFRKFVLNWS